MLFLLSSYLHVLVAIKTSTISYKFILNNVCIDHVVYPRESTIYMRIILSWMSIIANINWSIISALKWLLNSGTFLFLFLNCMVIVSHLLLENKNSLTPTKTIKVNTESLLKFNLGFHYSKVSHHYRVNNTCIHQLLILFIMYQLNIF
jgi:hypothetical protein